MVARRDPKILDGVGVVENEQLGPSSTLEVRRTDLPCGLGVLSVEDILGAFVSEGQDHVSMIARLVCYNKGDINSHSNGMTIERGRSPGRRSELVKDFL
jgi:hypothetical protein